LNAHAFELGKRSLGYRVQRLTRRVRHKMEMECSAHNFVPKTCISSLDHWA